MPADPVYSSKLHSSYVHNVICTERSSEYYKVHVDVEFGKGGSHEVSRVGRS